MTFIVGVVVVVAAVLVAWWRRYEGQLSTSCTSVVNSTLIAKDPSVGTASWTTAPVLGSSSRVGSAGQCCDYECYVCDYYTSYLKTAYDYSALTCPVMHGWIVDNVPSVAPVLANSCANCACKLPHDDTVEYPGFYCENVYS